MSKATLSELRAKLSPKEQLAAETLVDNEFSQQKRNLAEIADELGISQRTLYNWRQKPEFIHYMALISDRRLALVRAKADAQLIKLIEGTSNNGIPSVKGLELYYKLTGRLTNSADITVYQAEHRPARNLTNEELRKELEELDRLLEDGRD